MQTLDQSIPARHSSRPFCNKARIAGSVLALLTIGMFLSPRESRGDFYDFNVGVEGAVTSISTFGIPGFGPTVGSIGGGRGLVAQFDSVSFTSVDLSAIQGKIDEVTLVGSVTGLFHPTSNTTYASNNVYVQLDGTVSLLSTSPFGASSLAQEYQIIKGLSPYTSTLLGSFLVDDGVKPPFPFMKIIGSDFRIRLDAAVFNSFLSRGGTSQIAYLGFQGRGGFTMLGVAGNLQLSHLYIRTVPEPSSVVLGLIGIAGCRRIGGRRKGKTSKAMIV